jgi:hypothetical protein
MVDAPPVGDDFIGKRQSNKPIVPRQNSIRVHSSEFAVISILLFCVNQQDRSSNGQIFRIVLSWILQIKDSTPAGNRVSEKAAGNEVFINRGKSISFFAHTLLFA